MNEQADMTLFQLHANPNSLKSALRNVAQLWQAGDAMILLGETVAYVDWLTAYVDEMQYDEELEHRITDIGAIYILTDDLDKLDNVAKSQVDFAIRDLCKVIDDEKWIALTQSAKRVVTIYE